MADVTISQLPNLSPSNSTVVPISDGVITGKTTTSSLGVPIGTIVMWSNYGGASIPSGWQLCDGQAGRPDLRNRFVIGSGSSYSIGDTGGSADAIVVSHSHPFSVSGSTSTDGSHSHSGGCSSGAVGSGPGTRPYWVTNTGTAGAHSHSFSGSGTTSDTGSTGTNANLPPYYAVAFIIKIS